MTTAALKSASRGELPSRSVAICVDDFGLHDCVNAAVLALAAGGRISAVSCLVDGPAWTAGAAALRGGAASALDVGLHLNLTERLATTRICYPWSALVVRAYTGLLKREVLRKEIEAQLDLFEQEMGRAPDFVDGHRHVHQLPIVRDALIAVLAQRYAGRRLWLRSTAPANAQKLPPEDGFIDVIKPRVIAALGAGGLESLCRQAGFAQNRRLLGSYNFSGSAAAYAARLRGWLAGAQDRDLLMCHPATALVDGDPIATARIIEYQVLSSPDFTRALEDGQVLVYRLAVPSP